MDALHKELIVNLVSMVLTAPKLLLRPLIKMVVVAKAQFKLLVRAMVLVAAQFMMQPIPNNKWM